MPNRIDLVGRRYGRLLVTALAGPSGHKELMWECRCDCGTTKQVKGVFLREGSTKSCGCLSVEHKRAHGQSRRIDLTGQRFGRLVVVTDAGHEKWGRMQWRCVCDCGTELNVSSNNLRAHNVRSCGCLGRDKTRERNTTHGLTSTRAHRIWTNMLTRCRNPNVPAYPDYGGRGISVCDAWTRSFAAFYADMGEPPPGLTLDRIDNDGNYEPTNCRWATRSQQSSNRRRRKIWRRSAGH
jgi:hypothetical protein